MTQHLARFVIAEKTIGGQWPKHGAAGLAVDKARLDYEKGLIEMATRREGSVEYLYAIPRKVRGPLRPGYFNKQ